MSTRHGGRDFLIGAMIGSTLGALSTAMFTTKKGHKVQKEIMDKYHDFDATVRKFVHSKQRKVKHVVKKAAGIAKRKTRVIAKRVKRARR